VNDAIHSSAHLCHDGGQCGDGLEHADRHRRIAQPAVSASENLAFDRSKGNCLTCHEIKGGDAPGNVGPPLVDMMKRFPNRAELIAIITDETKRNPLTVMPPFGRNLILTEPEINAVVDFLYTR